jgi:hypothetical protein
MQEWCGCKSGTKKSIGEKTGKAARDFGAALSWAEIASGSLGSSDYFFGGTACAE